jgi:hypothetical protein
MIQDGKLIFKIEQIAISPPSSQQAIDFLSEIGADTWSNDTVVAEGSVFGDYSQNKADLNFNYDICDGKEFEVLKYISGSNWISVSVGNYPCVSHLGMHCDAEELKLWKEHFAKRKIRIAQEVHTISHTNPVIAGKRNYHYTIFATRHILGVDLKFIVRMDPN